MELEISDATEGDLEEINEIAIEGELFHINLLPEIFVLPDNFQFNINYLKKVLEIDGGRIFIAKSEGIIVGYAIVYPGKNRTWPTFRQRSFLYVDTLDVQKGLTNKGIGTALIEHCETFAKSYSYDYLELDVISSNTDAKSFYHNQGFSSYMERMKKKL
jgi:ribosomal protein S18 acetylase RimI-like enzyme